MSIDILPQPSTSYYNQQQPLPTKPDAVLDDLDDDDDDDDYYSNSLQSGAQKQWLNHVSKSRPRTIQSLFDSVNLSWVPATHNTQSIEIPYTPINAPAVTPLPILPSPSSSKPSAAPPVPTKSSLKPPAVPPTFPLINPSPNWSKPHPIGKGLHNDGNTCFLNSVLQVLIHTPPLVRFLESDQHLIASGNQNQCRTKKEKGFCMICGLKDCVKKSFGGGSGAYVPEYITRNIKKIAPQMRLGRQEDSHEFLRFLTDSLQASALINSNPKLDPNIKTTTFVHQIFGGKLRSRVTCLNCQHCSDTFDKFLDLSLDINNNRSGTLKECLSQFVKIDKLTGGNKYRCEKCKKLVTAEKRFTIEDAPLVLTIHLKRFRSSSGGKNGDLIKYGETLQLGDFMSDSSINPTYKLYGIVNHSGSGPHSGHYTAFVKSSSGSWYNMNDSSVSANLGSSPPINQKNAYILFYCRDKGDSLKAAINDGGGGGNKRSLESSEGGGGGKRARTDEEDRRNSTSKALNGLNFRSNQQGIASITSSTPAGPNLPPTVIDSRGSEENSVGGGAGVKPTNFYRGGSSSKSSHNTPGNGFSNKLGLYQPRNGENSHHHQGGNGKKHKKKKINVVGSLGGKHHKPAMISG